VLEKIVHVWRGGMTNGMDAAGIIDSQSVKGADTIGRDSRGYGARLVRG
jgi:hypothetical protein